MSDEYVRDAQPHHSLLITHNSSLEESDSGLTRNTRDSGYRCSVPGLAGFTEPTLCGARSLIEIFEIADCRLAIAQGFAAHVLARNSLPPTGMVALQSGSGDWRRKSNRSFSLRD